MPTLCKCFGSKCILLFKKNETMKKILSAMAVVLFSTTASYAQIKNAKTETVKVYGNCGMCKTTIEKAANKKKISKADWNVDSKMATITYDSRKTKLDAVLKNIALAGYDNQSFLAPDAAYNKLPGCCKYDREKKQIVIITQQAKDRTNPNHNNHQQDSMNITAQEMNQMQTVFNNYFALKDALVKSDGNSASTKATDLETAINAVKMDILPKNMHTVWMNVINELKGDATHIKGTKDIAHQRNHFIDLSKNMYELIKVSKFSETVYYQFCPMANDGKGANWLSRESGIKNPYYGAQMLSCGSTVETLKQ